MNEPFVCVKCGGGLVKVSEARPSVDDRYAVGFCASCAPPPATTTDFQHSKRRPAPPRTVALIRKSLYDPSALDVVHRRAADAALVARVHDRTAASKTPPTDAERERADELIARWVSDAQARVRR